MTKEVSASVLQIIVRVKEYYVDIGEREDVRFDVEIGSDRHYDLNHQQLQKVINEVINDL